MSNAKKRQVELELKVIAFLLIAAGLLGKALTSSPFLHRFTC
jgi:hypothetical protein